MGESVGPGARRRQEGCGCRKGERAGGRANGRRRKRPGVGRCVGPEGGGSGGREWNKGGRGVGRPGRLKAAQSGARRRACDGSGGKAKRRRVVPAPPGVPIPPQCARFTASCPLHCVVPVLLRHARSAAACPLRPGMPAPSRHARSVPACPLGPGGRKTPKNRRRNAKAQKKRSGAPLLPYCAGWTPGVPICRFVSCRCGIGRAA